MSKEEAERLDNLCLEALSSRNGITALCEGLITPEQVSRLPDDSSISLDWLLTEKGLSALREGLITAEQAIAMPNHKAIGARISNEPNEPEAPSAKV